MGLFPEFRGQGLGTWLLIAALNKQQPLVCRRWSSPSTPPHIPAIGLHKVLASLLPREMGAMRMPVASRSPTAARIRFFRKLIVFILLLRSLG